VTGVPQADDYSEGLACEHGYMIGPPCNEAAFWVLRGTARCAEHFEAFVEGHLPKYRDDLRAEAQRIP
jgi:hypothetical protein